MGSRGGGGGTAVDKKKEARDKARKDANTYEGTTVMSGEFNSDLAGKFKKYNEATEKFNNPVRERTSDGKVVGTSSSPKPLMSDFGIPEKKKKKLG